MPPHFTFSATIDAGSCFKWLGVYRPDLVPFSIIYKYYTSCTHVCICFNVPFLILTVMQSKVMHVHVYHDCLNCAIYIKSYCQSWWCLQLLLICGRVMSMYITSLMDNSEFKVKERWNTWKLGMWIHQGKEFKCGTMWNNNLWLQLLWESACLKANEM